MRPRCRPHATGHASCSSLATPRRWQPSNARSRGVGGEARSMGCDVADRAEVDAAAAFAIEAFGAVDTWVNNAGVALFGRLDETPEADGRRLFETNFWGTLNGSLAAVRLLRERGWRARQRRQHRGRFRHPAPGPLLREQACREGFHRHAPHRARIRRRADLGDADQARRNRDADPQPSRQHDRTRAPACPRLITLPARSLMRSSMRPSIRNAISMSEAPVD